MTVRDLLTRCKYVTTRIVFSDEDYFDTNSKSRIMKYIENEKVRRTYIKDCKLFIELN